jgi:hypothetical protein
LIYIAHFRDRRPLRAIAPFWPFEMLGEIPPVRSRWQLLFGESILVTTVGK